MDNRELSCPHANTLSALVEVERHGEFVRRQKKTSWRQILKGLTRVPAVHIIAKNQSSNAFGSYAMAT